MIWTISVVLLLASSADSIVFQSFGVRGTLMCGEAPAPGIRVKLWDNDMGRLLTNVASSTYANFHVYRFVKLPYTSRSIPHTFLKSIVRN